MITNKMFGLSPKWPLDIDALPNTLKMFATRYRIFSQKVIEMEKLDKKFFCLYFLMMVLFTAVILVSTGKLCKAAPAGENTAKRTIERSSKTLRMADFGAKGDGGMIISRSSKIMLRDLMFYSNRAGMIPVSKPIALNQFDNCVMDF